jgi:alpha-beta hydrolase superfamily lysophospholipase
MPGDDPEYKPGGTIRKENGKWKIIRDWKPEEWLQINAGWISAIDRAQDVVQNKPNIQVPILLMHSDRTWHDGDRKSLRDSSDIVLDVADISRYGRQLGREITEATVKGGTHDLVRSAPGISEAVYRTIFDWLKRKKL